MCVCESQNLNGAARCKQLEWDVQGGMHLAISGIHRQQTAIIYHPPFISHRSPPAVHYRHHYRYCYYYYCCYYRFAYSAEAATATTDAGCGFQQV